MSTTKGAPSSRSFISFTVSPESARFCNCCSTVCLVERVLALLLFPLSPHQMLASLKSLLLFTGFIGLEVRGWCEAILTFSVFPLSSLLTHVTSSVSVSQLSRQLRTVRVTPLPGGPGLMSAPTSDEGWETRSDGGCSNTRHHEHGWMKIARNYGCSCKNEYCRNKLSIVERSAVYLASSVVDVTAQGSDEWRIVEESGGIHHSWK